VPTPLSNALPPSLSTKEGWRSVVAQPPPAQPPRLRLDEWKALSPNDRDAYDAQRLDFVSKVRVKTRIMDRIVEGVIPYALRAIHSPPGVRGGHLIDGPGGLGKSTTLIELGRRFELQVRRAYPPRDPQEAAEWIPVVYVSLPGTPTTKSVNQYICDFFGIPFADRDPAEALTRKIRDHAQQCGTALVALDDIHFINTSTQSGEHLNNHLKNLANLVPATFVYAGIGCTSILEDGDRANPALSQMRRRFRHWPVYPFDRNNEAHELEWLELLAAYDRKVVLLEHRERSLLRHADYIFDRTQGCIGSVSELIRNATLLAMRAESERLTVELMDEVELDAGSEEYAARRRPSAAKTKRDRMLKVRATR
jgi:hypothetical protein